MKATTPKRWRGWATSWQSYRPPSNASTKKASIVDVIEVFMAFSKWMQFRMSFDDEITPELLKTINKYHDLYINELLQNKFNQ